MRSLRRFVGWGSALAHRRSAAFGIPSRGAEMGDPFVSGPWSGQPTSTSCISEEVLVL